MNLFKVLHAFTLQKINVLRCCFLLFTPKYDTTEDTTKDLTPAQPLEHVPHRSRDAPTPEYYAQKPILVMIRNEDFLGKERKNILHFF